MNNTEIFGFREEIWGEIVSDCVQVHKEYIRTARDAAIPPGQAVEFEFYAALFPFYLLVLHLSDYVDANELAIGGDTFKRPLLPIHTGKHDGTVVMARRRPLGILDFSGGIDITLEPPELPDPIVPFEITFTLPNGLEPIVFTNPRHSEIRTWPLPSGAGRPNSQYLERARGKWRISVKNINENARRLEVHLTTTHAVTPIGHQDIPLSLLNNLLAVALQKVLPTIEYDKFSGNIVVSTPTHFLDLMGVDRVFSLGSIAAKIVDDLPTFTPCFAGLMSPVDFIALLTKRRENIIRVFDELLKPHQSPNDPERARLLSRMNAAIDTYDDAIRRLQNMSSRVSHFCIVLEGMFTNPEVEIRWVGAVADIENKLPQIGLVFNERFELTTVISTLMIDLSPLLAKTWQTTAALTVLGGFSLGAVITLIGGIKVYNSIDKIDLEKEIISKILEKETASAIEKYVKRMFERITAFGVVALHCKLNPRAAPDGGDNLHIQYFNPSTARPPHPGGGVVGDALDVSSEVIEIASGEVMARPARAVTYVRSSTQRRAPYVEKLIPVGREAPGSMPPDFEVPNPERLERLDNHDCIAIVMMENRSYDHFFYELPLAYPGKGYRQPPASYSNTAPGFKEPFRPIRNISIGIGNSLIFFPGFRSSDPYHNYDHTIFQIGDGTNETIGTGQMQGFAADFAKQSDSPQIVMSYMSINDLPVYKALAKHYPVCDRWFVALPVGTFPNRLASLQGNVPFLYNVHMDDPAIGYLEDYSIFDLLNSQGISWKFFESDIGTIRLYDRFRLDVSNVRPFGELDETLRQAGSGGSLPRVLFIEPQFLFGNDDHPPMSVRQGQLFIRYVVGKFIEHGLLDRTLFVITYDEHGGFFDHVAPPGTPPDTDYGEVESLYPQDPDLAPTCLGVRVPSLVLSKWTSARANHTVLDHTTILKTILLHNRDKISTAQFGRFGERVKKRGHLGQVLDRLNPRVINYANLAIDIGYSTDSISPICNVVGASRSMGMTPEHPANVLRGIALPRARMIVERA